jgi:hypothetical protein
MNWALGVLRQTAHMWCVFSESNGRKASAHMWCVYSECKLGGYVGGGRKVVCCQLVDVSVRREREMAGVCV